MGISPVGVILRAHAPEMPACIASARASPTPPNRGELQLEPLGGRNHVEIGPDQVSRGPGHLARHPDGPAFAPRGRHGAEKASPVAPVVLEPLVVGDPRDARHRYHVAIVAERADVAGQLEPARSRLVDEPHGRRRPCGGPPHDVARRRAARELGAPRFPGGDVEGAHRDRPGVLVDRDGRGVAGPDGVLLHGKAPFCRSPR